jgi:PKD repeat protein
VTATDANGCSGAQTYVLTVCPILTLSPESLAGGAVGTAYSQAIVASGGTSPYRYTAAGLPSSLMITEAGGVLSGTPTAAGTINLTVTATDANGCSVSRGYAIVVTDAPPVIADLTLSPAGPDGFTLSIAGTGFVEGAVVIINGVSYPATFVSPMLLTVVLPASAIPATGSITATVTNPGTTGGTSNPAALTFCDPPGAPLNPTIEPAGNATAPPTGTDFLRVRWEPPVTGPAPAAYEFRINGDPYTVVVGAAGAVVPPRGSNDPMTLFVRAHCNADVAGPEVASPTYSLAPPVADFTFSAARVGSPVNFTDTSSPQATSWLWIFDDGDTSTLQSPMHTFTTAGTHRVALIASNGSGSSQVIKEIVVSASTSGGGAVTSSVRAFETADGGRWSLPGVKLAGSRHAWLALTSSETEETIVYLRLLDGDGLVVLERRLAIAPGQPAVNDVGAYGVEGTHTLEIVSSRPVVASLSQPDKQPTFGEGPR